MSVCEGVGFRLEALGFSASSCEPFNFNKGSKHAEIQGVSWFLSVYRGVKLQPGRGFKV